MIFSKFFMFDKMSFLKMKFQPEMLYLLLNT